jgi:hypothetical protein
MRMPSVQKMNSGVTLAKLLLVFLVATTVLYMAYKISDLESKLIESEKKIVQHIGRHNFDNSIEPVNVLEALSTSKSEHSTLVRSTSKTDKIGESLVHRETCNSLYKKSADEFKVVKAKKCDITIHKLPDVVSKSIEASGVWEEEISNRLLTHFGGNKNHLFIDVGGNIGYFTSLVASQGHRVVVVEPFQFNVPLILNTICELNPKFASEVSLYKYALSNVSGTEYCIWSTSKEINNGNARVVPIFKG